MSRLRREDRESTFELELAPMLALMVSIIPLLLMNMSFSKMTVIDSPVPQVVLNPRFEAKPTKQPDVNIYLYASAKDGVRIVLKKEKGEEEIKVPLKDGKFDLERVHREAVQIKQKHPDVFRLEFSPDDSIAYNEVVAIMDKIRNRTKTDPKIQFKDDETGKTVETDLLFPDVVLANVVEG